MKIAISLIFALIFVNPSSPDAAAAALRSDVTVESDVVRLGDLFTGTGGKARKIVAEAPAPGGNKTFSSQRLASIAQTHGISWSTASRFDKVLVLRAGRLIDRAEIEEALMEALIDAGMPLGHEMEVANNKLSFYAATGPGRAFRINEVRYRRRGGRFVATLVISTGRSTTQRLRLTGRSYAMIDVPVLARRTRRGEVIGKNNLMLIPMRRDTVNRNAILDAESIIGMVPRRLLSEGVAINLNDLRRPVVVAKGAMVTIVLRTERMILTARGRAMRNAAMGETVSVTNTRSRSTIEGVVAGPNRVIISLAPDLR